MRCSFSQERWGVNFRQIACITAQGDVLYRIQDNRSVVRAPGRRCIPGPEALGTTFQLSTRRVDVPAAGAADESRNAGLDQHTLERLDLAVFRSRKIDAGAGIQCDQVYF